MSFSASANSGDETAWGGHVVSYAPMDDKEFRERQEEHRAKRAEAAKGITNKRTMELGDELLRPIGARMSGESSNALTPTSRAAFHEALRDVVVRGQDDELIERQSGWSTSETKGDDVA